LSFRTASHQTQKGRSNVDPLRRCKDSLARIGEAVGQRSLRVTTDTYSHVLSDERELSTTSSCGEAERPPRAPGGARGSGGGEAT
jgi:hypothetical protein